MALPCLAVPIIAVLWWQNLEQAFDDYAQETLQTAGLVIRNDAGRLAITRVVLHPRVRLFTAPAPARSALLALHHEAHERCFIANSVKTPVVVVARD